MKKVNFSVALKNGEGKNIQENGKDVMMSAIIADTVLACGDCKSAARMYTVGMAIYGAKGEVEIEDQDWTELKRIITAAQMRVIVKGPIEKLMETAKEDKK